MTRPKWQIRNGRLSDIPAVSYVHSEAATARYAVDDLTPAEVKRAVEERCSEQLWHAIASDPKFLFPLFLIAQDNGQLIGFTSACTVDGFPNRVHMERLFVLPSMWGSGVAHALVSRFIDECLAHEYLSISLWSAPSPRTRRFYEKCGFIFTGKVNDFEVLPGANRPQYEYVLELVSDTPLMAPSRTSPDIERNRLSNQGK